MSLPDPIASDVFADGELTNEVKWYTRIFTVINSIISFLATALADTGWQDISLSAGIVAGAPTPQARIKSGVLYVQGLVQPSGGGNFAASSTISVGTLPAGMVIAYKINVVLSGSNITNSARGIVDVTQAMTIITGPTPGSYYDLAGLSGATID